MLIRGKIELRNTWLNHRRNAQDWEFKGVVMKINGEVHCLSLHFDRKNDMFSSSNTIAFSQ